MESLESAIEPANIAFDTPPLEILSPLASSSPPLAANWTADPLTLSAVDMVESLESPIEPASFDASIEPANIAFVTAPLAIPSPLAFSSPPLPANWTADPLTLLEVDMVESLESGIEPASFPALIDPAKCESVIPLAFTRISSLAISILESSTLAAIVSPLLTKPSPATTLPRPLNLTYVTVSDPKFATVAVWTKAWSP